MKFGTWEDEDIADWAEVVDWGSLVFFVVDCQLLV